MYSAGSVSHSLSTGKRGNRQLFGRRKGKRERGRCSLGKEGNGCKRGRGDGNFCGSLAFGLYACEGKLLAAHVKREKENTESVMEGKQIQPDL